MHSSSVSQLRKPFVLLLIFGITVLFLVMIRAFLIALLFAALIAGLLSGIYRKLCRRMNNRRRLAAALIVSTFFLVILLPLLGIMGMVIAEALHVTTFVKDWLSVRIEQPGGLGAEIPPWFPAAEEIRNYTDHTAVKLGQFAGAIGSFLIQHLSKLTQFTVSFLLDLFVFGYALYFFFVSGQRTLDIALQYIPLSQRDKQRILARGLSVTRATLKGTFVIGILQGGLAGCAFAVLGVPGALFWGVVMAGLSIIPGIGAALVWVPAAVFLLIQHRTGAALGLTLWCALVVGSVDNILRPRMVGNDTRMPDLLILVSTLGGLALFGAAGIVLGPLVSALFMMAWEIYGAAFHDEIEPEPLVVEKR